MKLKQKYVAVAFRRKEGTNEFEGDELAPEDTYEDAVKAIESDAFLCTGEDSGSWYTIEKRWVVC